MWFNLIRSISESHVLSVLIMHILYMISYSLHVLLFILVCSYSLWYACVPLKFVCIRYYFISSSSANARLNAYC